MVAVTLREIFAGCGRVSVILSAGSSRSTVGALLGGGFVAGEEVAAADANGLVVRCSQGGGPDAHVPVPGLCIEVIRTGEAVNVPDARKDARTGGGRRDRRRDRRSLAAEPTAASPKEVMVAPICPSKIAAPLGAVQVLNSEDGEPFSPADLALLCTVAEQLGQVLHRQAAVTKDHALMPSHALRSCFRCLLRDVQLTADCFEGEAGDKEHRDAAGASSGVIVRATLVHAGAPLFGAEASSATSPSGPMRSVVGAPDGAGAAGRHGQVRARGRRERPAADAEPGHRRRAADGERATIRTTRSGEHDRESFAGARPMSFLHGGGGGGGGGGAAGGTRSRSRARRAARAAGDARHLRGLLGPTRSACRRVVRHDALRLRAHAARGRAGAAALGGRSPPSRCRRPRSSTARRPPSRRTRAAACA